MRMIQVSVVAALAVALAAYLSFGRGTNAPVPAGGGAPLVEITLPAALTPDAVAGKVLFDGNCAVCHGPDARGQEAVAPPLVHVIYEPSHHGDLSFQRAVSNGVRQHHWPFGDMPPVENVTTDEVALIIAYVRELQRANGIN